MGNTALVQIRVEPGLKEDVESILNDNGLDIPTAVRMFFAKVRRVGGIPFDVRSYSAETIAAFEEADLISRDKGIKTYSSFSEILDEAMAEMADE